MTSDTENQPMHVYDWLELPPTDEGERLAKEWLDRFTRPADVKHTDGTNLWLPNFQVTVEWQGVRYECTGASSMGDVWLRRLDREPQDHYDYRVNVEELSNWQRTDIPVEPPELTPKDQVVASGFIETMSMRAMDSRKPTPSRFMAATAILAGAGMYDGIPGLGGGPSGSDVRNDPNRPKTEADLERLAAAQAKRDRKATKRKLKTNPSTPS